MADEGNKAAGADNQIPQAGVSSDDKLHSEIQKILDASKLPERRTPDVLGEKN